LKTENEPPEPKKPAEGKETKFWTKTKLILGGLITVCSAIVAVAGVINLVPRHSDGSVTGYQTQVITLCSQIRSVSTVSSAYDSSTGTWNVPALVSDDRANLDTAQMLIAAFARIAVPRQLAAEQTTALQQWQALTRQASGDQQYLLHHLSATVSDAELRAAMEKMPPIEADNLLLNADLTALAGHNCEAISP
jgi:hypothetical protein